MSTNLTYNNDTDYLPHLLGGIEDNLMFFVTAEFVGPAPCCRCNNSDLVHTASDGHQYCVACTDDLISMEYATWGGGTAPEDCSHKQKRRKAIEEQQLQTAE